MSDKVEGYIPFKNVIFSGPVDFSKDIKNEDMKNQTIVITGGASGFGAAFCKDWAKRGANIIIGDINAKTGEELIASVRKETGNSNHHFIPLNVTDWNSQISFFRQASQFSSHHGIDCVVASAGICDADECNIFEYPPDYQSMENPPEPKMRTLDINLNGLMYTTTLATSYLSRNPGSKNCSPTTSQKPRDRHLILISSIAGTAAICSQSIYCASKHGVVGLFRALRTTAPIAHGIRINMLNPYFVDTPIIGAGGPLALAGGAMAQIEDVVDAATRLVVNQSIIGRALMIGPRGTPDQLRAIGLEEDLIPKDGKAVWDCYAHDFEQSDLFTRRVIAVTNVITLARGWTGAVSDVWTTISRLIWRSIGY